jgi:hypothetical protein
MLTSPFLHLRSTWPAKITSETYHLLQPSKNRCTMEAYNSRECLLAVSLCRILLTLFITTISQYWFEGLPRWEYAVVHLLGLLLTNIYPRVDRYEANDEVKFERDDKGLFSSTHPILLNYCHPLTQSSNDPTPTHLIQVVQTI